MIKDITFCGQRCDKCVDAECPSRICEHQEPCDDAISRADIQNYIAKYLSQYLYEDVRQAVEVIDTYIGDMPSVQPSHKGHWIQLDYQRGKFECSECHTQGYVDTCMYEPKWNFCPNCGADMGVNK